MTAATERAVPGGAEPPGTAPGESGDAGGHHDGRAARRCIRCGAVGTHYLTCPDLRLPSGFRFGAGEKGRDARYVDLR